ncbi:MAG: lysylphosphatidylglycerol synthase transmembrane domain-containing protein [Gemmatimonadaceae bacterium]
MRLDWRGVLGIALSVLLLWLTLRGVDLRAVWRILATSSLPLWLLSAVTATVIFPLRARRWQAILVPLVGRLPVAPLWRATAIGMMVNNVLLARAGEPARAFVLSRERPEVRFTAAFGSLVVDRVFDGIVVLALMVAATLDPRFPADATVLGATAGNIAVSAGFALTVAIAALYALVLKPEPFIQVAERVTGAVWARGVTKVHALLTGFASGLRVLREPRLVLEVLWWTLLHWLTNAAAFYLGFRALGIAAPLTAAFFVQGLIAISVVLPSSPGFFGLFEAAGTAGLGLYGIPAANAVSWAIGFHLLSFIPITVIGVWYVARLDLRLRDLGGVTPPPTATP